KWLRRLETQIGPCPADIEPGLLVQVPITRAEPEVGVRKQLLDHVADLLIGVLFVARDVVDVMRRRILVGRENASVGDAVDPYVMKTLGAPLRGVLWLTVYWRVHQFTIVHMTLLSLPLYIS